MSKPGDRVRIHAKDEVFEGILLPRPDLYAEDVVVLKLKTGYNMGIDKARIKKIDVLEEYKKKSGKAKPVKQDPKLPKVAILSTGGTIASKVDYRTGGVSADYTADDFVQMCPELSQIANISTKSVLRLMSEDATLSDWLAIAKAVHAIINDVDGVVITHGTDTMHYTAAALSFLLKDLGKPVIVTGAQRSIDRGSSDAFMNLICAVTAASSWDGAEVAVCMHGTMEDTFCDLIRGTKVRKMHTSRRDAFRAVNDEPLARVFPNNKIEITNQAYQKRSDAKPSLRKIDQSVALIHAYPDMDPKIIDFHVKQGAKAIVFAGTALGHLPLNNERSLYDSLLFAKKKGVLLFMTTQTLYGRVHPYVYANLRKLSLDVGVVYLADMLPEVAYTKACVALTQKNPVEFMVSNIANEFVSREIDDYFLR